MKAIWKNTLIACSDDVVMLEGNAYFPKGAVDGSLIESSDTATFCAWKGTASYYTLCVKGQKNSDAAWYYANPFHAARNIKNRVAFWKGVEIIDDQGSVVGY
ncbi:MAG: DUF427 domain-containing protein [Spongiibacteraceae bacterium]|nr:DUF427 domain-containing protein [Spongiibacteraceae bacterium]